jgi:hypothetical protein
MKDITLNEIKQIQKGKYYTWNLRTLKLVEEKSIMVIFSTWVLGKMRTYQWNGTKFPLWDEQMLSMQYKVSMSNNNEWHVWSLLTKKDFIDLTAFNRQTK